MADTGVPSRCGGGADLPLMGNLPMLTSLHSKGWPGRSSWEHLQVHEQKPVSLLTCPTESTQTAHAWEEQEPLHKLSVARHVERACLDLGIYSGVTGNAAQHG